jgi:CTP:molybdopterin cytidylyltransferase MocA
MIWTVVLAAGASTRMGEPKALLAAGDGRRFVDAIAASARQAGCAGVMVVVGPPHGEAIRRALGPGVATAWNPQPERGMLSSVQAGVAALPPSVSAVLIWPVDIPYVTAATVRQLLDAAPGKIIVPLHNKRGGHPLRVPRRLFAALMALEPSRGLKALLDAHSGEVERLAVVDRGVLLDVDTPDDYARTRA